MTIALVSRAHQKDLSAYAAGDSGANVPFELHATHRKSRSTRKAIDGVLVMAEMMRDQRPSRRTRVPPDVTCDCKVAQWEVSISRES